MSTQKKLGIVLIVIIILAVAYYLLSPLWNNIVVNEELPENIITTSTETPEEVSQTASDETPESQEQPQAQQEPAPQAEKRFAVTGTTGHPASGYVRVIETTTGPVIRYEDYKTINGPELHVYLSKDLEAEEYIDLGDIKGTEGNINYTVPEGVDIEEYPYVLTWCEPFGVLFNYAELQ